MRAAFISRQIRRVAGNALTALFALVALASCTLNQSQRSQTDRAMRALNQNDYEEADAILAQEHSRYPDDRHIALLLAQAKLGLAHFQMLEFVDEIAEAQDPSANIELDVTPRCDNGAVPKIQGYDVRCLLYRVLQHLPDVDDPNFIEAHHLLDQTYPDPATTPQEANFLTAVLDASTALYRFRTLTLRSNSKLLEPGPSGEITEEQFHFVVHNLKSCLLEARRGLIRLKHSYGKVRQFIISRDGKPLIKIGDSELTLNDSLDFRDFVRFSVEVIHDNAHSIDTELNHDAADLIREEGYGILDLLKSVDRNAFGSGVANGLNLTWESDRALTLLFNDSADVLNGENNFRPAEFVLNHLPRLFEGLKDALIQAWDTESRAPLIGYFDSSRSSWVSLRHLSEAWDHWFNGELTPEQREALQTHFTHLVQLDPRFAPPSPELPQDGISLWERSYAKSTVDEFSSILLGNAPDVPDLTPKQVTDGVAVLAETSAWIDANF